MNEGYWQNVVRELVSDARYRTVVKEYCKKYNLERLPNPQGHESDPTSGYVYFKHEEVKNGKISFNKDVSSVDAGTIVRILEKGGHLAPEQVEADENQENPPEMEVAKPIQKIKLPKIGEAIGEIK